MMTTGSSPQCAEMKQRMQAMWMEGDFGKIATSLSKKPNLSFGDLS